MPATVFGNPAAAIQVHLALNYGEAPGYTTYQRWLGQLDAAGSPVVWAHNNFRLLTGFADSKHALGFGKILLSGLGITSSTLTAPGAFDALSTAVGQFLEVFPQDYAVIAYNAATILSQLEGNATYGRVARAWNQKVSETYAYSIDPQNTRDAHLVNGTVNGEHLEAIGDYSVVNAGDGRDTIYVGRTINGQGWSGRMGSHGDLLTGGPGVDQFGFFGRTNAEALALSTGANVTKITDFSAGTDRIVFQIDGDAGSVFRSISIAPTQATDATSEAQVWQAITALAGGTQSAAVAKVVTGAAGRAWLYMDNSNGAVDSNADLLIDITGYSGTIRASDIAFAFS